MDFKSFDMGSYSRNMIDFKSSIYFGKEYEYKYNCFGFEYVNSRQETYTTTDGKGNMSVHTRTVYDTNYRYGIIVDFNDIKDLLIQSNGAKSFEYEYKTESINFNNNFNVSSQNELTSAKFLTPKIILIIEEMQSLFYGIDFEFNYDSKLCISFEDDIVKSLKSINSLSNPSIFKEEISGKTQMIKLNKLLEYIHQLMVYSNNN